MLTDDEKKMAAAVMECALAALKAGKVPTPGWVEDQLGLPRGAIDEMTRKLKQRTADGPGDDRAAPA